MLRRCIFGIVRSAMTARSAFPSGRRFRGWCRRSSSADAIARSILVIVWSLLADRAVRYHDLGADYYASRIDKNRKTPNHVRQVEALG
jgi:hypothetical protein